MNAFDLEIDPCHCNVFLGWGSPFCGVVPWAVHFSQWGSRFLRFFAGPRAGCLLGLVTTPSLGFVDW